MLSLLQVCKDLYPYWGFKDNLKASVFILSAHIQPKLLTLMSNIIAHNFSRIMHLCGRHFEYMKGRLAQNSKLKLPI